MNSWHVRLGSATVPLGINALDFQPLAAVALCGIDSKLGCQDYTYHVNDGLSRVSWWVSSLQENGTAAPAPFFFQVRVGPGTTNMTTVFQGRLAPGLLDPLNLGDPWLGKGLIVQVSQLLGARCELWGVIDPEASADVRVPYNIKLEVMFDRMDSGTRFIPGPATT